MNKFKQIIKKYFSSFAFFYRELGNKIFILVSLSLVVSILDGFGLTMFLPLLQMVNGDGVVDADQMGNMGFIVNGAEYLGISLSLVTVLLFMIVFFIFKGIGTYINQIYGVIVQHSFIRKLRLSLLSSINTMSFKNFITSDAGRIQNTLSGEVDRVSTGFQTYFAAFQQGIMVLVYVCFAFFIDWQFAILVGVGGVLTNLIYKIIYSRTKKASTDLTESGHVYQGLILQHIGNFKYLKATGMVETHSAKLEKSIFTIEGFRRKLGFLSGIGIASREPLLIIVVAIVIIIQVKFMGGAMGAILISLLFFYRALASLMNMQQSWNSFLGVSGSLQNMQNFQDDLNKSKEKNGTEVFEKLRNGILCRNLNFSFGETDVLKNINLQITKKQSVAFVGESGSGKTTLVNVLSGLLDPSKGEVLIDEQSIQKLNKTTYQKRIGYITQEAVIFSDTIFNNVSFWADKTPENLNRFEKAIKQAALTGFVESLPNKEETELGNNGINVSGGQKQRISIARELFKEIDILIMDEATSALDSETENAIQESIDDLKGSYTLIIVAHRLATIKNVDKIIYMQNGTIEQEGSFKELLNCSTKFRKMVELQEL